MFTKVKINGKTGLALAPLSVLPEYQRQGTGSALIHNGHSIARELGYDYSIVLGSERYYPKFGYVKAYIYGIKPPFNVPLENFMVCDLNGKLGSMDGVVEYAPEFFY